ncbi:unnamed protein product, partial [Clonostachys rosea]
MRCDGNEPVCGACVKRGTECTYQHSEHKRRPPSKKYVESLHARIRHLESQLASSGTSNTLPSAGEDVGEPECDEYESDSEQDNGDDHDPLSELTGLVGRLAVVEDGQIHYFGSQSSFNLPRQSSSPIAVQDPWVKMQTQGLAAAHQLGMLITVSTELEEHLLDLYWRWQNPWNYIVHKGAFLRSRRGLDGGRYCSPLLLSAIFAISARYSDRIELRTVADDPSTAGNAFCEQAKVLLLYESEAPSVTTVQAAAILALRIMSDGKEALGWLYCGNATRMAHNLGLHIDCSTWVTTGLITEDEAEVRKVTWWGCFVVDKLFSCGLGRPSSIHKSGITCPKPTIDRDDEYSPWVPKTQGSGEAIPLGAHSRIASTAHFVSECMSIACEALEMIYAPNSRLTASDIRGIVSKADLDLREYYNALPPYLRLPSSPKIATLPHIYLSQPLLQRKRGRRPTNDSSGTSEATEVRDAAQSNEHMEICRDSAIQISKLMDIYRHHYSLRQIPIAAVHLSFAAAVIHLIDARPTNPNWTQAARHLQTCVNALRDLRTPWCAWADRSLKGVQLLALDWYRCDDVSQLQRYHARGKENSLQPATNYNHYESFVGNNPQQGNYDVGLAPENTGEMRPSATNEAQVHFTQPDNTHVSDSANPFALLFDTTELGSEMDDMVRDWLAESRYDWLQTELGGDSSSS